MVYKWCTIIAQFLKARCSVLKLLNKSCRLKLKRKNVTIHDIFYSITRTLMFSTSLIH